MKYKIDNVERVLRDKDFDVFIHGCNSKGKFGSGIAGVVRKVYPNCAETYRKALNRKENNLGDYSIYFVDETPKGKLIYNAITQDDFGYDGSKYGSYDAIDHVFQKVAKVWNSLPDFYKNKTICYPLIGCGLGGLQWSVVKEIIDYRLQGLNHFCIVRQQDVDKYNLDIA